MVAPAIIGGLFTLGSTLIEKLFPDPAEQERAKLELLKLEQNGDLAQIGVNLEQAKHEKLFVSGARPAFMWIGAVAIGWHYVAQPALTWLLIVCGVTLPPLPLFDLEALWVILTGLLGIGGYRTFEKYTGTNKNR